MDKIKEMHVLDNIESTFHVCKWLNASTPSTTIRNLSLASAAN